jgi:hypothetical protein
MTLSSSSSSSSSRTVEVWLGGGKSIYINSPVLLKSASTTSLSCASSTLCCVYDEAEFEGAGQTSEGPNFTRFLTTAIELSIY